DVVENGNYIPTKYGTEIPRLSWNEEKKGKSIALKVQKARKGSLSKAFKVEESCEEVSNEEGSDENELSFISRKINSMWKNKGGSIWKNNSRRHTKEAKDKSQVVCYQCKKPRYFKFECPNLEKEKEKEKKTLSSRRRKISYQHGITLIYLPLKKRMKKQTCA
ncbi:hypothetical protein CR513_24664, partial [Mucuna pruriens]